MSDESYVVRIRGLPWQATREEIVDFFTGCNVKNGTEGILMTLSREGRPSGEAYVELDTEEDYNRALEMNKKHMGSRYIEVFASKKFEMEQFHRRHGYDMNDIQPTEDAFVRLRGLPFSATKADIVDFFSGLDLAMDGIVLPTDHSGRSTGEAYIQFASRDYADKAMSKHKDKIGHRYIEIFKSSFQEYRAVKAYMEHKQFGPPPGYRNGPYGPPPGPPSPPMYPPYHKMGYRNPGRPVPYPNRFRGGPYGNGYGGYGPPISGASRGPPPPGASRRPYDFDDLDFRGRPQYGRYPYNAPAMPPAPPHNPFVGRHTVHMRGLPYKCTEGEIFEFFLPLRPITVQILFDDLGRPSGEADVEFATHDDAVKAMNKDKAFIQKRYIELFLHSTGRNSGSPSIGNGNGHRAAPSMAGWPDPMGEDDLKAGY